MFLHQIISKKRRKKIYCNRLTRQKRQFVNLFHLSLTPFNISFTLSTSTCSICYIPKFNFKLPLKHRSADIGANIQCEKREKEGFVGACGNNFVVLKISLQRRKYARISTDNEMPQILPVPRKEKLLSSFF